LLGQVLIVSLRQWCLAICFLFMQPSCFVDIFFWGKLTQYQMNRNLGVSLLESCNALLDHFTVDIFFWDKLTNIKWIVIWVFFDCNGSCNSLLDHFSGTLNQFSVSRRCFTFWSKRLIQKNNS
jgi:hypothetical protein